MGSRKTGIRSRSYRTIDELLWWAALAYCGAGQELLRRDWPGSSRATKTAHEHYSKEGKILSLVVMTTAEQMSADLTKRAYALETELTTPVKFVLRKEMMRLLSRGLMTKMSDGSDVI
jgi:hypothetical protein